MGVRPLLLGFQIIQFFLLQNFVASTSISTITSWPGFWKTPSKISTNSVSLLFKPEEEKYERYAAALAATEPIRKLRDRRAKQTLLPFEFWLLKRRGVLSGGKGICDLAKIDPLNRNDNLATICNQHVISMTAIIKALGLTVSEFNALSMEVSSDAELRRKVMKQAYNYRLSTDKLSETEGQTFEKVENGQQEVFLIGNELNKDNADDPDKVTWKKLTVSKFASLITSVEQLRKTMENEVKQELHIQVLPEGIYHPTFYPMMTPKVQRIYSAFPKLAAKMVEAEGINTKDFNKMLSSFKHNPFQRYRINRRLKQYIHKNDA